MRGPRTRSCIGCIAGGARRLNPGWTARLSRSRGPARWMTSRSPPRRRTSPLVCTGDTAATVVPDDSVVEIGQGGGDAPIGVERLDIG